MRKADFEDTWETNFLLFTIPILLETFTFFPEINNVKKN